MVTISITTLYGTEKEGFYSFCIIRSMKNIVLFRVYHFPFIRCHRIWNKRWQIKWVKGKLLFWIIYYFHLFCSLVSFVNRQWKVWSGCKKMVSNVYVNGFPDNSNMGFLAACIWHNTMNHEFYVCVYSLQCKRFRLYHIFMFHGRRNGKKIK